MYHTQYRAANGEVTDAFFSTFKLAQHWCVQQVVHFLHRQEYYQRQYPKFVACEVTYLKMLLSQKRYHDLLDYFNQSYVSPPKDSEISFEQLELEREAYGDALNSPCERDPEVWCSDYISCELVTVDRAPSLRFHY